ncbi:Sec-independent protein translocase protein TatB [Aidingimonas lacisalsi]|uniref:Sec-independent protein translocase protein TatB n=1 Tax=Aidingimonas lacisalsi TaxID=2604086 RepID=UPI0011D2B8E7|nr:Sec-independent protein translocase protein TatB [Aidingimonas lacisalsi]
MFDIGFLELLLLGVVGLLVLGPERLPKAARTLGLWIGKIKRTVSGMQREISAQLEAEELRQKLDQQQKKLDDGLNKVKRDVESYAEPDDAPIDKPRPAETDHAHDSVDDTRGDVRQRLDKALSRRASVPPSATDQGAPSDSTPADKDDSST